MEGGQARWPAPTGALLGGLFLSCALRERDQGWGCAQSPRLPWRHLLFDSAEEPLRSKSAPWRYAC
jgi:hypothetical protein